MAAGTFMLTNHAAKIIAGAADLDGTAAMRVKLFTNSGTPNITESTTALGGITNTEASGGGYAYAVITNPVMTTITDGFKFESDAVAWTASGTNISAWRKAVFYFTGTIEGVVDPVIGYFLGDSTDVDVPETTAGNTLTLNVPANGWFDIKHANP